MLFLATVPLLPDAAALRVLRSVTDGWTPERAAFSLRTPVHPCPACGAPTTQLRYDGPDGRRALPFLRRVLNALYTAGYRHDCTETLRAALNRAFAADDGERAAGAAHAAAAATRHAVRRYGRAERNGYRPTMDEARREVSARAADAARAAEDAARIADEADEARAALHDDGKTGPLYDAAVHRCLHALDAAAAARRAARAAAEAERSVERFEHRERARRERARADAESGGGFDWAERAVEAERAGR